MTMTGAVDRFGRVKRKLRVSLTDRCNFRCPYCMPEKPNWAPREQLLTRPELRRLLRLFVRELGITHLRFTGGEPLLRVDLEEVVAESASLRGLGLARMSVTTNAYLLAARAHTLRLAGVADVNVSLDALTGATFERLSGGRPIGPVLEGIAAAQATGLPVKLNAVVIRGWNEDEIVPLTRWALERRLPLRFIEFMPLDGRGLWSADKVISERDIVARLADEFALTPLPRDHDPATYYLLDGHYPLGIISTVTRPFCKACDRLRLTATGALYPCLFSAGGPSLRDAMRAGATDAELLAAIRRAVWNKDAGYEAKPGYVERPITMHVLGG
jgi:GTP 3',8-cyclase